MKIMKIDTCHDCSYLDDGESYNNIYYCNHKDFPLDDGGRFIPFNTEDGIPAQCPLSTVDHLSACIKYLWQIIDDIDTAGDAARSDDAAFRRMVEKAQVRRWETGITSDGYELDFSGLKDLRSMNERDK
jgi:hypothetical protein